MTVAAPRAVRNTNQGVSHEAGPESVVPAPPPSARDPRREWARLTRALRERPFRSPTAQLLADWSEAVRTEEAMAAWQADHPDGTDLLEDVQ
jgi:hypothetical protein